MKKMLSLTMAAMMAATMLPTSAFANNQTGWEYNAGSTLVNKIKQQKTVGQYDIGVGMNAQQNYNTSTQNNWIHGGLDSNGSLDNTQEDEVAPGTAALSHYSASSAFNTTDERFDPWDIAADNAPEVHIQVSGYSVGAEGLLNDSYPYMLSEIDVEVSDASLVKVNQAWFDAIADIVDNGSEAAQRTLLYQLVYNDIVNFDEMADRDISGTYSTTGNQSYVTSPHTGAAKKYVAVATEVYDSDNDNVDDKYKTFTAANINLNHEDTTQALQALKVMDNYNFSQIFKNTDLTYGSEYPVVPLDAVDITHLISVTRNSKTQRVSTLIGSGSNVANAQAAFNLLINSVTMPTGTVAPTEEDNNELPDFYAKNIQTKNMGGGVYGVSSFTLEVRSYDGFDEDIVEGSTTVTEATFDPFNNGATANPKYQGQYIGGASTDKNDVNQLLENKVFGSIQQYDIISIKLPTWMNSSAKGTASVSVYSPSSNGLGIDETFDYATLVDSGLNASYTGKTLDAVAEEEFIRLSGDIVIKESVAGSFDSYDGSVKVVEFKLNRGFEFVYASSTEPVEQERLTGLYYDSSICEKDDDYFELAIDASSFTNDVNLLEELRLKASTYDTDGSIIYGLGIESTSANEGDVAEITITIDGVGYGTVQVAEVVDYAVLMYTDASADVPTMFSGVNRDNDGLTTGVNQNYSMEVTIEETFPGAWDMAGGFNINLPEDVYVVNKETYTYKNRLDDSGVNVINVSNLEQDNDVVTREVLLDTMASAYNGQNFEFGKRPFNSERVTLDDDVATMVFQLVLTAEYDFEGPVYLELELSNNEDPEPVVIANFIKPYTITAEQNDVIIDYRYTSINTEIVFTEYETGLLATKLGAHNDIDRDTSDSSSYLTLKDEVNVEFDLTVERGDYIKFENSGSLDMDGTSDGSMSLSVDETAESSQLVLEVEAESRYAPMEATISGLELFMDRTIPAGAYELNFSSTLIDAMKADYLFGSEDSSENGYKHDKVGDADTYTVHDSWVNVITAGTDKDNTFLTRISATVGADYITAGEKTIDLSSTEGGATPPPYINENDRMMVPVRAVTEALGDSGIMVTWDQEGKAVGIIYPDRVISIVLGENIATVNGTRIALNEKLEMKNDRVFLPFRDLGNLLGVSDADIVWDNVTRTAIINATNTDKANIDAGTATTDVVVESEEEVEVEEVVTTEEV